MKDRYIVECKCIDEGNDFGLEYGEILYYNPKATSVRYLTRQFSKIHWEGEQKGYLYLKVDEPENYNPYNSEYISKYIPVTKEMDNARIYKNLGTAEKEAERIESIGDFQCRILVIRTIVEPYIPNKHGSKRKNI